MNQLVPFTDRAPALVAASGVHASYRFPEFFTAEIRNFPWGRDSPKCAPCSARPFVE